MAALAVVLVVQFACNEPQSWSRSHSPSPGDYSKARRSTFKNVPSFFDRCTVLVVTTGGTPRYTSIQDVLDRLLKFTTKRVTIDVASGTYKCFIQGSEGFVFAGARSLSERYCWLNSIAPVVLLYVDTEMFMSMDCASKRFKKICVFCGISSGKDDVLSNEALNPVVNRYDSALDFKVNWRIHLVYNRGSMELMSQVAHKVKSGGGHVIGSLAAQWRSWLQVQICTRGKLNWLAKQVGLLSVNGFYDTLLTFFDKQLEEEFFDNSARSIVVSAPTTSELLDKLEAYTPVAYGPKLCWEVERPHGLGYTTNPIASVGQ